MQDVIFYFETFLWEIERLLNQIEVRVGHFLCAAEMYCYVLKIMCTKVYNLKVQQSAIIYNSQ